MDFIVLGNLDNPRTATPARYQDCWGWLKLLLSSMGLFGFCLWLAPPAYAQDALCAEVKIVIEQKLSLERQAFDAHMTITNGLGNAALEDIRVVLNFADQDGNPVVATTDPNATGAAFFMRLESLTGIGAVDGTGQIAPKSAGDIHWLIIPAAGTGGAGGQGQLYYIGATLEYRLNGENATVEVTPDYVMVRPQPLLQLDYFLPTDVYADDPFTSATESPVPFTLGVRINNAGGGISAKTSILSAQPRIVDNQQGLLIDFQIIGGYVDDEPAGKSLLLDFGDINAGTARMGRWSMVTTLSGRFVEFDAEYQHADSLGGAVTSLIDQVTTHTLVHDVKVDLAGRDNISDFLALDSDTLRVYESDNVDTLVADQSVGAQLENVGAGTTQLRFQASAGFAYARVPDPYQGTRPLAQILRSDGKVLAAENAWLSKTQNLDHSWSYFINIFDADTPGLYNLRFATSATSALAGIVYNDGNGNGLRDVDESGIGVVPIALHGSDENGANVSVTAYTDASGQYQFTDLVPGRYTLTAGLVNGYTDGIARAGTSGGVAVPGTISDIVLTAGSNAESYLFAKRSGAAPPVDESQADLAVTMTATPTRVKTGDTISLVITARNQGSDAASATSVSVTIPGELSVANNAQASVGSYAGGLWTIGALAADASASLTLTLTVGTLSEPISVSALIASAALDPQAANNSAHVTLTPEDDLVSIRQSVLREPRIVLFIACPEAGVESERAACVARKTQVAEDYLTAQDYRHEIVTQATAFKRALRGGRFNVYWLSGVGALLTESLANELRLAVLRGEGLILDGAAEIGITALETVTGTQVGTTTLGQDLSIALTGSGTIIPTQGSAWPLDLQGATTLATFDSGQNAISVYNQGPGRTWVAGFDLWTSLAQPAAEVTLSTLVSGALDQMASAPTEPVVGGLYVPLTSTVQNDGEARELTMRVTLSDGLGWLDAEPLPLTADTVHPIWSLSMQADESQTLRLGLRAPTTSGTATIQTELSDTDQQLTVGSGIFEFETVSAADLLAQANTQIEALAPVGSDDQDRREEALTALNEAQSAYADQDDEAALTALCAAEAALAEITGGAMQAREAVSRAAQAIGLGATSPSNDPANITAVGGTPQEASVNTAFPAALQAQVRDAQGTPVADVTVTFSLPTSGASARFVGDQTTVTATTDADGIARSPILTANSVVGSYAALARVTGVAESARFALSNTTTTPQPLTLAVYSGNNQQTRVTTAFAEPLAVVVRNAIGTPVAGVTVIFTTPSDGASARFGSASSVSVTTDADGIARSPTLTANSVVGSFIVSVTTERAIAPIEFHLSNTTSIATGQTFTGMTATGTGVMTASITGGGPNCAFDLTATRLSSAEGLPDWLGKFLLPHGVFTYALVGCETGGTVQITMTWPDLRGITGYLKYGPTPWSRTQSVWYAPRNLYMEGHTVRYTVQDGGWGDDDLTANGVIRDPGGPVIQRAGAAAAAIPTLSESALAGLILAFLLLLGGRAFRRGHRPFHRTGD